MKKIIANIMAFTLAMMMNITPAFAAGTAYLGPNCTQLASTGDSCYIVNDINVSSATFTFSSSFTGTAIIQGITSAGVVVNIPAFSLDSTVEYNTIPSGGGAYVANIATMSRISIVLTAPTSSTVISLSSSDGVGKVTIRTPVQSISGTANQINVASSNGAFTLSIPNNPILPGVTTVGGLLDSNLTPSQCVATDAFNNLVGIQCYNGTVTNVSGTGNISVINNTTTPIVSLTGTIPIGQIPVIPYSDISGTPSPYTAGTGISVTSGVIANTGVLTATASGNIASSGGQNPNMTLTGTIPIGNIPIIPYSDISGAPTPYTAGTGISLTGTVLANTGVLTATASGNIASSGGQNPNMTFTGILPIANGGTNSATQNFVDLTTPQTVAGIKTFSSPPVMSGASITSGTIPYANISGTPTPYTAGTGISVTSGVIANTGVLSNTGTANQITVSSGTGNNTLSIPSSPTLPGTTTVGNLINSGLTASNCIGTNGSKQESSNTNCVQSVTGTANQITVTGTATPTLSIPTNPVLPGSVTIASGANQVLIGVTGATQIASQNANNPLAIQFPNTTGTTASTFIGSNSTNTVQSISGSVLSVGTYGGANALSVDGSGDLGVAGSIYSAGGVHSLTTSYFGSSSGDTIHLYANGCGGSTNWFSSAGNTNAFGVYCSSGTIMSLDSAGDLALTGAVTSTNISTHAITDQTIGGGSGTYTTPAGVKWLDISMVGGGGGGGGSDGTSTQNAGSGGNATATTFGTSVLTANGGVGGGANAGQGAQSGGSGTCTGSSTVICVLAISGGGGSSDAFGPGVAGLYVAGGAGGNSCWGGGAGASINQTGYSAASNSGGGGAGGSSGNTASTWSGGGGSAGGCVHAIINSPSATYPYTIGAGGTPGSAGTSGNAGGSGSTGTIIITEHYNL